MKYLAFPLTGLLLISCDSRPGKASMSSSAPGSAQTNPKGGNDTGTGNSGKSGDAGGKGILTPGSETPAVYEAEAAFSGGTATPATALAGFTGKGYLEGLKQPKDRMVFAIQNASLAQTTLTIRYANKGAALKVAVLANGAKIGDFTLDSSPVFKTGTIDADLRAGLNTITLIADTASDGAAIDSIETKNAGLRATRGATLGFVTYEAEDGQSTGTVQGPSREYLSLAAEASGRKAVELNATGQYVEWKTTAEANAIVLRYSMPDAAAGGGTSGTLSLYVDGVKKQALALSSHYAWVYGDYPYNNDPTGGGAHRFFDESRFLVDAIPNGATVRLQKDADDKSPSYTIDLMDMEVAPAALARPADSLSIADYGAIADDGKDDADAIRKAIVDASAQNKVLWIPKGEFGIFSRIDLKNITIRGAGPWYSVLKGSNGKGGFNGVGDEVGLYDFAVFGDVSFRDDANFDAGIDGSLGKHSNVQNLWFEHTKVGIWIYAPSDDVYIVGCRIRDTYADGINFDSGIKNSAVEQSHIRNTGDDSLAMWSQGVADENNVFRFNTAQLPILANTAAIYGGTDNSITDSIFSDTVVAGAGITVSTRFSPAPFAGITAIERNTLIRTGSFEPNFKSSFGAVFLYADTAPITAEVSFSDLDILDSTFEAILFSFQKEISNTVFDRVKIDGAGTFGINASATGTATFNNSSINNTKSGATNLPVDKSFTVTGTGNTGF